MGRVKPDMDLTTLSNVKQAFATQLKLTCTWTKRIWCETGMTPSTWHGEPERGARSTILLLLRLTEHDSHILPWLEQRREGGAWDTRGRGRQA